MTQLKELKRYTCGAPGFLLNPGGFFERKGYKVICSAKSCSNKSKEYKKRGNAIRFWNLIYWRKT